MWSASLAGRAVRAARQIHPRNIPTATAASAAAVPPPHRLAFPQSVPSWPRRMCGTTSSSSSSRPAATSAATTAAATSTPSGDGGHAASEPDYAEAATPQVIPQRDLFNPASPPLPTSSGYCNAPSASLAASLSGAWATQPQQEHPIHRAGAAGAAFLSTSACIEGYVITLHYITLLVSLRLLSGCVRASSCARARACVCGWCLDKSRHCCRIFNLSAVATH